MDQEISPFLFELSLPFWFISNLYAYIESVIVLSVIKSSSSLQYRLFKYASLFHICTCIPFHYHPQADTPLGRPPSSSDTMGYRQQAGGTHPTGMHTCYLICSAVILLGLRLGNVLIDRYYNIMNMRKEMLIVKHFSLYRKCMPNKEKLEKIWFK